MLDQLRERIADLVYRVRPLDFVTYHRRWFWQRPATPLQAIDSLTPDQAAALGYALLQHLRRNEEEQR
jgi:hypothetical protein